MTWSLRAFILICVAVLVLAFAVFVTRSEKTDCIAVANEATAKNPEVAWKTAYNSCASNRAATEADLLRPKAVKTVPTTTPIGAPVPSRADPR